MKIKNLKIYYPAIIVLIALLSFTLFAYYQAKMSAQEKRERMFDNRLKQLTEDINLRMQDYIQILKGCQGLFYGSDSITANDWKVYINSLDIDNIYPGIQGIAYAAYIPASDSSKLEETIRKSGFSDFNIRSSFKNDYLTPIIFIEPFTGRNLRAFGYDMYSDDARRKAMYRALITGKAAMTSKVTLVQETKVNVQPGFLMYMPVYRSFRDVMSITERKKNIQGFVYYPFRSYDLMKNISKNYRDLHLEIYDGSEMNPDNLLFDSELSDETDKESEADSEFQKKITLIIAGRQWKMLITSNDRFVSSIEKSQPAMILTFGVILSVLFFIMIFNIIRQNRQISLELQLTRELDNKKDEFIGIASHELKTPLTSIKAYIQLLERSDLKEQERKYVTKANSNVKKLNNLIGDLLDVSKVQSGQLRLNIAPFELRKMISESVENVQHMYSSHKLIVQGQIPDVTLTGDILRLEQAMNNLLLNAIKYSPAADAVYIRTQLLKKEVKIEVIDQGIGVAEENHQKIFDRFYRAKELSPVISGLGMGLFISSEIIKRHNGNIGVYSNPDQGSTFYIVLPLESV
jgi:two-component system, OmpR family, sensor kinase